MSGSASGRLVVVSGPSGVGKSTVLKRLFEAAPVPLVSSVSATTRPPRPGEVDGVDYHFLSEAEFARRRRRGGFLECFEVFGRGHWYGTLLSEVAPSLEAGNWVLLEIDVQGSRSVVEQFGDAITIFLRPPSLEVLEERLRRRQTETEAAIETRLGRARQEMASADQYRYQVVNDDVDRAVREICDILNTERRLPYMLDELREEEIVKKVGGRFKLSTLIQKRLVALNQGSPALVDLHTEDKLKIVIQEILEDKIYLDTDANLRIAGGGPDAGGPPEMDYRQL